MPKRDIALTIDVSNYPADTGVPSFQRGAKSGKCGGKRVDVRPDWKEQPARPTKLWCD